MLSKTVWVLDLAEPITDIHYHSGDSIDSVKRPAILLLASPITVVLYESGMRTKILSTFWTYSTSLEEVPSNLGGCGRFRGSFVTKGTGAACCPRVMWVSGVGGGGGGGGGVMVPPSPLPSPSQSGGGVQCLRISSSMSAEIPLLRLLVVFSRSLSLRLMVVVVQSRVSIDS